MNGRESLAVPERSGSELTRQRILDAAERLFAERGIEGVSTREIAAEARHGNVSAVNYYFGDKEKLVSELLADRIARIEVLRRERLDKAAENEKTDEIELLRMLWQPLIDVDAGKAGHWFIRFQLSCHLHDPDPGHPLATDPVSFPASHEIIDRLARKFPHLAPELFHYRLGLVALMFLSAVSWHDKLAAAANMRWSARFSLDETVKMAVEALRAAA